MTCVHLVIDAANVVGSRPDGWWRDRAGAAERLVDQVTAASAAGRLSGSVTVVLEGAARAGAAETAAPGRSVRVMHAPHDGDSAIVALVASLLDEGAGVCVVTADRALREQVTALGASAHGPSWLLAEL
jgi:8-oxo-dGTP diphosphatase